MGDADGVCLFGQHSYALALNSPFFCRSGISSCLPIPFIPKCMAFYNHDRFIKYLGREGLCTVDETPKGWYITYIDRDPKTLAKQEVYHQWLRVL